MKVIRFLWEGKSHVQDPENGCHAYIDRLRFISNLSICPIEILVLFHYLWLKTHFKKFKVDLMGYLPTIH